MDDDDDSVCCPVCNGPAYAMGTLGNLLWLRCRDCGMEFNQQVEPDHGDTTS